MHLVRYRTIGGEYRHAISCAHRHVVDQLRAGSQIFFFDADISIDIFERSDLI
jgi:hypothetical protein